MEEVNGDGHNASNKILVNETPSIALNVIIHSEISYVKFTPINLQT
jgi:hypothetical protein